MNMMYGYGYQPYFGFSHFFGSVFWLFLIVMIVLALRRRRMIGGGRWGMWGDSALTALRERYAKGEISKEEYEERKKVLMG